MYKECLHASKTIKIKGCANKLKFGLKLYLTRCDKPTLTPSRDSIEYPQLSKDLIIFLLVRVNERGAA